MDKFIITGALGEVLTFTMDFFFFFFQYLLMSVRVAGTLDFNHLIFRVICRG